MDKVRLITDMLEIEGIPHTVELSKDSYTEDHLIKFPDNHYIQAHPEGVYFSLGKEEYEEGKLVSAKEIYNTHSVGKLVRKVRRLLG